MPRLGGVAGWVCFLLLLCTVHSQDHYEYDNPPLVAGSFIQTIYTATLTGNQVVPTSLRIDGWGTAFCELSQDTNVLFCHVCHNVEEPARATISLAERLENGPVIYEFDVSLGSYFEQGFQLVDQEDYPLYSQINDFLFGRWYITIESFDQFNPIRGQLEQVDNVFALMTSEAVAPLASGPARRGITVGTYTHNNPLRQADYDLCHNVEDATFAVVGRGVPGYPGQFVFDFRGVVAPITGQFKYTRGEENELQTGYQYTQVRSESNPQGAIRGQLSMVDPIPTLTVTGRMDGNQAAVNDTFARGCILVYYNCDSRLMEFLVFHSVPQATRLEVRAAPAGSAGNLLFAVGDGNSVLPSPLFGSRTLTGEQEYILYAQQMYFQLNSVNYPAGEIRGQLTTQYDYFTIMTGIQVVPPVTTANMGCATFDLTDLNYNLDFEIMHSIDDVLTVNLYRGGMGEGGDVATVRHFVEGNYRNSVESPLIGDMILDDDEQRDWITDRSFVQVASERFPFGEIRGQVMRIAPCDPQPRDGEKPESSFPFSASYDPIIELPLTRNVGNGLQSLAWESLFLFFFGLLVMTIQWAA